MYGVATGLPLPSVIANLLLEGFEEEAFSGATYKPCCWFQYIDDTFLIWPCGAEKLGMFLDYLNSSQSNVQFSMET
jgi:hypothetical protein